MAITGIDTIDGKQIIAAGAISAKSAEMAYNDENGNPITGKADASALTAYQEITGMTAYQEAGSYLSANALDNLSGNWETVTAKLDTTAFSDVSGTFLTAHQDLSDYQTINGMTAYQEAGDYYSASNPSGFITGVDLTPYQTIEGMTAYQPVGDYLTTADSGTFLTALPADVAYTGWVENSIVSATSGLQPSGLYLSFNDLRYIEV